MENLIKETAKITGVPEEQVRIILKFYFRSFKKVITKFKYRELKDLKTVKTNVVIPGLGRLVVSHKRKKKFRAKKDYYKTEKYEKKRNDD